MATFPIDEVADGGQGFLTGNPSESAPPPAGSSAHIEVATGCSTPGCPRRLAPTVRVAR